MYVQVTTFGMGLVTLDVRQESSKHSAALDAITTFLGIGSYLEWDEQKRRDFLTAELSGKRPLMPSGGLLSPHLACTSVLGISLAPQRMFRRL